jgi:hypothetical protein
MTGMALATVIGDGNLLFPTPTTPTNTKSFQGWGSEKGQENQRSETTTRKGVLAFSQVSTSGGCLECSAS